MIDMEKQFKGKKVPLKLQKTAVSIMRRFAIYGQCDGMYICNRIALFSNIGNGAGEFYGDTIKNLEETAAFLKNAYSDNIFPEDLPELEEILRTGKISKETAVPGIVRFIKRTEENIRKNNDAWRIKHLLMVKIYAEEMLGELMEDTAVKRMQEHLQSAELEEKYSVKAVFCESGLLVLHGSSDEEHEVYETEYEEEFKNYLKELGDKFPDCEFHVIGIRRDEDKTAYYVRYMEEGVNALVPLSVWNCCEEKVTAFAVECGSVSEMQEMVAYAAATGRNTVPVLTDINAAFEEGRRYFLWNDYEDRVPCTSILYSTEEEWVDNYAIACCGHIPVCTMEVFRIHCRIHNIVPVEENVVVLAYISCDSHKRPVYRNKEGRLFVDVNPRAGEEPKLCTKLDNQFNGEPDTPVDAMKQYDGVKFVFWKGRKIWN